MPLHRGSAVQRGDGQPVRSEDNYTSSATPPSPSTSASSPAGRGSAARHLRPERLEEEIRVAARPNKVVAGKAKRVTFVATTIARGKRIGIQGASLTYGGTTVKTDKGGRARIRKTFSKPGRQRGIASLTGLKPGKANVDVRRPAKKKKK